MNPSFVGFSWENNSSDRNAHYSDRAVLIAYCDALGLFCFTAALYTRDLKEARLNIEKFDGYEIQTWMSFISAEGTKLANSVYTGKLKEWGDWSNPDYDGEGLTYKVPVSEPAADATYIDPINETPVPKRATPPTPIIPIKKVIVPEKATPKAIHKVKHGMATNLANQMEFLLTFVYRYLPQQMEPLDAVPLIYDHVITDEWPNVYIDYSKFLVFRGELETAREAKAEGFPGYVKFTWANNNGLDKRHNDSSILVVYSEYLQKFIFKSQGPVRHNCEAVFKTGDFEGVDEVHTWLGFINENRNKVSNSVYGGKVRVV
jgi:hypothetical protein